MENQLECFSSERDDPPLYMLKAIMVTAAAAIVLIGLFHTPLFWELKPLTNSLVGESL